MPELIFSTAVFQTDNPELKPVLDDLLEIAQNPDGALRNLLITQRYHDISQSMAGPLGALNLNWCTFACWASKTAGQSIRGEDLPKLARTLMAKEELLESLFGKVNSFFGFNNAEGQIDAFDDVKEILGGVSAQIAEGNLKVYAEIAPLFARFGIELGRDRQLSEQNWNQFSALMPSGLPEDDGQDLLKYAFREYYESRFVEDDDLKAEKILRANVLVGLHEQTRLQSAIKGAMNVPVEEGLENVLKARARLRLPQLPETDLIARLRTHSPIIKKALIEGWERIATRVAMHLALPGGKSINLGRDVPLVDGQMFPPTLKHIQYGALRQLIAKYDANPGNTRGSAATDWSELKHRMNFILDLFRANQENNRLFAQPFNQAQRDDFNAGRIPRDETNL